MKRGVSKMGILLVALYLVLTVSGLILYKLGANKDFLFSLNNGVFQVKLSLISIIGLLCYLCSFLIYMLVLPKFDLTYIMPVTSAVTYISVYVLSVMVLKETIQVYGIVGSIIILIGVIIMNMGGK